MIAARAALVVLVCALAYAALPRNDFVDYDDFVQIHGDAAVQGGLPAAVSLDRHWASGWQPLSSLSLAIDARLFGLSPLAFHLENWLWHALSALLVLAMLSAFDANRATFAALLFAVHPLTVEAVAWAAERRTVLSVFFALLSLAAWGAWTRRGGAWRYVLSVVLFAAALCSKALPITLPAMMVALDFWPLRRGPRLLEKVPFALVGAAIAAVVLATTPPLLGGVVPALNLRAANAAVIVVRHLAHFAWPLRLAVFYPYPTLVPAWQWAGALALICALSAVALLQRVRRPWLLASWLWFLAALLPTLGFRQAGVWAALADRHAYLALLGPAVALAWSLPRLPLAALTVACAALTFRQVTFWQSTLTLFTRAAEIAPESGHVEYNLGTALFHVGRLAEAERALRSAHLEAEVESALDNQLGAVLEAEGRDGEALSEFEAAVQAKPVDPPAYCNLGYMLADHDDKQRAAALLRKCIAEWPAIPPELRRHAEETAARLEGAK